MMSQVNKNKPPLQLLLVTRENKQNIRFQINYKDKIRSDDIRISTKQALGFNIVILLFSLVNGKESRPFLDFTAKILEGLTRKRIGVCGYLSCCFGFMCPV